jgi:quinohemoprotein ethanol dehydrogenase
MTYRLDGKQYVAVLCGHGGTFLNFAGTAAMDYVNEGRLLTFALGGTDVVPKPAVRPPQPARSQPPERRASRELVLAGRDLYVMYCGRCHTIGIPAITPDLSRSATLASPQAFNAVVLKGALIPAGMGRFDDLLSEADTLAIQSYLIDEAWKAYQPSPR